ncbi:MAG: prepilin peptidase [Acetobacteraceae bacterium]
MTGESTVLIILTSLCLGLLLVASWHDIAARTIPNGLVLLLAVTAAMTAAWGGFLPGSLLSAAGVFGLAAICWRCGWMGGGDVKLLGAAALALPPSSVLTFLAAMAIAGALLAIVYLIARTRLSAAAPLRSHRLLPRIIRAERWRISRGGPLPYACAIGAGFLFAIT